MKRFKTTFLFFLLLGLHFGFAQQNEFFRAVKEEFDAYENRIDETTRKLYEIATEEQKLLLMSEYNTVKSQVDSTRNAAYFEALIKTKIASELKETFEYKKNADFVNLKGKKLPKNKTIKETIDTGYSTGIDGLRKEVMENFYIEGVREEVGILESFITFVIEPDGSISQILATGENRSFNRQTEIALYLLSGTFTPARIDGNYVRSKLRLPLRVRFE